MSKCLDISRHPTFLLATSVMTRNLFVGSVQGEELRDLGLCFAVAIWEPGDGFCSPIPVYEGVAPCRGSTLPTHPLWLFGPGADKHRSLWHYRGFYSSLALQAAVLGEREKQVRLSTFCCQPAAAMSCQ